MYIMALYSDIEDIFDITFRSITILKPTTFVEAPVLSQESER